MKIPTILLAVFSATLPTISFAAKCFTSFSNSSFANCESLSSTYALHWNVSGDSVILGLQVDTDLGNWMAFGVSEGGGMRGTDIVIVHRNNDKWEASDRFSSDKVIPEVDPQQDWKMVQEPSKIGDSVIVILSRKLKTCDPDDFEIIRGTEHPVVWAIGRSPEVGYHGSSHLNRGDYRINFAPTDSQIKEAEAQRSLDRSSFNSLTFTMPNYTIPAEETAYKCINIEFPDDKKYHIVEYEPLVENSYVHHILIYQCSEKPRQKPNEVYDCASMTASCASFSMAWAPGIKKVAYPIEAGLAIGNSLGAMRWGALQLHYNNPDKVSGVLDSSGMKVTYTEKTRPYDTGVLAVGSFELSIPPGGKTSTIPNICSSTCTERFAGNLTLVSNFFHMHLLGTRIKTQHIRNGVELEPLGYKNFYDFNYQNAMSIPESSRTLIPGDTLITTCSYDGAGRSLFTKFGEGSKEEMCFNFLLYYPKIFGYPEICLQDKDWQTTNRLDYCTSWGNIGNWNPDVRSYMNNTGEVRVAPSSPRYTPLPLPSCPNGPIINETLQNLLKSGSNKLRIIHVWGLLISMIMALTFSG